MTSKTIKTAPLFVLLGAMLWGTIGTAQAFAPDIANPLTIGATKIAIGGFALLVISFFRGTLKIDKSWPILSTMIAAIGMAAYQPLFFIAVSKIGIAIGTVVAVGSAPTIAGILSFFVRKERPEKIWYVATILASLGCLFLFAPGSGGNVSILGVLLALGAGLAYASYALASKQLLDKYPSDVVEAVVCSISAILLSPLFFIYKSTWLFEPRGILIALHLGLFATALAYLLFARGLASLPVATVVTLTLAEPLTATFLGVFLVRERLAFSSLVGITFIFLGLLILSVGKKNANNNGAKETEF